MRGAQSPHSATSARSSPDRSLRALTREGCGVAARAIAIAAAIWLGIASTTSAPREIGRAHV